MADIERYYKILGLLPGATGEEIKRAYRDMAQKWHPDRFVAFPEKQRAAHEKMRDINAAYAFLKDQATSVESDIEFDFRADSAPHGFRAYPPPDEKQTADKKKEEQRARSRSGRRAQRSSPPRPDAAPAPEFTPPLRVIQTHRVPFGELTCVALNNGSCVWAGGKGLFTWRPHYERAWDSFEVGRAEVTALSVSPYGKYLLVGCIRRMMGMMARPELLLFDASTGQERARLRGLRARLTTAAFSHDDKLILTGDSAGNVILWDAASGSIVHRLPTTLADSRCVRVAFSGEGTQAITLKSGKVFDEVMLWNVQRGKVEQELRIHMRDSRRYGQIKDISPAPDGRTLVVANNDPLRHARMIHLWDMPTGQEIQSFQAHDVNITQAICVPNGERILSADEMGFLRLWNYAGRELGRGSSYIGRRVLDLTCSTSGKAALSAHPDGMFWLWELP